MFSGCILVGPCTSSQFDCGDDSCVPSSLQCNGNVNCNYSWDEEGCDVSPPSMIMFIEILLKYSLSNPSRTTKPW